MPAPLRMRVEAKAIERWIDEQWLTMREVRSVGHFPELVEARRRIAVYLDAHQWSSVQIGRFLNRDHTTVLNLLKMTPPVDGAWEMNTNGHRHPVKAANG